MHLNSSTLNLQLLLQDLYYYNIRGKRVGRENAEGEKEKRESLHLQNCTMENNF